MRIPFITLIGAGALALGGCAYGDLGLGPGYGDPYYSGYGYGSPYYGAGYGGYYGGYGYSRYGYGSPYYGGFGYSPFGWYDNYYYPGTGIYVYDSYRRPRLWTNSQRSYWTSRQRVARTSSTKTSANWSGFSHRQQQIQQQHLQTTDQERQQRRHRSR